MRRTGVVLALTALLLVALAPSSGASTRTTVTIGGSGSASNIFSWLAEAYARRQPFRSVPTPGHERGGVRLVAKGKVDIGLTAAPSEPTGKSMRFTEFARQAACVATNLLNRVPSLTRAQIASIFSGETRNWREVPGAQQTGPIHLLAERDPRSPADSLERRLGVTKLLPSADSEQGPDFLAEGVADDELAIAYLPPATAEAIHLVAFNGVPCTRSNVESGRYPVSTSLFWVTKGRPTGAPKEFLDWVSKSSEARRVIAAKAYPVR